LAFVANLDERDPLLSVLRWSGNDLADEAYRAVWTTRALATRAITARRQGLARTEKARQVWDQLRATRRKLAEWLRDREGHKTTARFTPERRAQFEKDLLRLNEEKERLERQLAEVSAIDRRHDEQAAATVEDLLRMLPGDVAVVDLLRVKHWERTG